IEPEDSTVPFVAGFRGATAQKIINLVQQDVALGRPKRVRRVGRGNRFHAARALAPPSGAPLYPIERFEMIVDNIGSNHLEETEQGVRMPELEVAQYAAAVGTELQVSVLDEVIDDAARRVSPAERGSQHNRR